MIHPIRRWAREIHRRSVWQVLFVYLVGGWIALFTIETATQRIGLPGWTPGMALVLFLLLLPIVVATALVQGGLPWLRMVDAVDPNELEGLTPADVLVVPESHPLYGISLLTWRNAILLGVMSVALLVTSVVAYLTMWALGIGPVGSLLAQGVIREGEPVLVTDFENHTDERDLGVVLADVLSADLSQSTLVRVADRDRVADALRSLGDFDGAALTPARGFDVALAEQLRVVLNGEVYRTGASYRLSVAVVLPPNTSPVARFREAVEHRSEIVPALDLLGEKVRAKLGESLRDIRAETPLVELVGAELPPGGR